MNRYTLPESLSEQLLSPALIVYMDLVRANVQRVIEAVGGDPGRWRPHIKTVKLAPVFLELARDRYGETFPITLASADGLAKVYLVGGRPAESEELARAAVSGARESYGPTSYRTGLYMQTWGRCLAAVDRQDEAEPALLESYKIVEATRGATSADTVGLIESLIELYEYWGKKELPDDWRTRLP